jgi:hypothetical protein
VLRTRTLIVVVLVTLAVPAVSWAQSELVITRKGTKEYHRPGCDAIKDAKDVLALTRAQATARGLTAHEACDPSRMPPPGSDEKDGKPAPDPEVFVDGSRYYHKKDCSRLGKDAKKMKLDDAGRKFWPCPTCKPPIRRRK